MSNERSSAVSGRELRLCTVRSVMLEEGGLGTKKKKRHLSLVI